ncbi:cardiolipin synthase [Thermotalea metallivorans]|uniref:Cardiolipin synthase n=1 Tax=Thermotalea metallivorans TaxID=520762 RepID=A0A140L7S7_9FIRM|nr:cardiolipin synthase [Thermotalea metallivorans]KXG76602.1 Major cardiolipin synthase ClsA [Thermotalea metallivorans]
MRFKGKIIIGVLLALQVLLNVLAVNAYGYIDYLPVETDFQGFFQKAEMFLGTIFTLYTIFIALVIFMENKNPAKTIAWLLILFLVPVIGFIFYLFLGQNFRKRNIFKKKKHIDFEKFEAIARDQREAMKDKALFKDDESFVKKRLISLILNNANAPFTINNRSKVLTNGEETFQEIIEALQKARHHIHLEYFIIKDDGIGGLIKNILMGKAREGIKVRVIYDSVGSWKLSQAYLRDMREAGVEIYAFLPVYFPVLSRELNYRNHRKIIVVDGKIGFLGGLNIGDEYLGGNPHLGFWRDTHLCIEGEAVYGLQNIFFKDWHFVSKEQLPYDEAYFPKLSYYGEQLIQIAASGPDSDWQSIMQAYFATISSAEEKIWINTPYLVPDESIMMALKTAALSGVDVRIILPSYPDHRTVFWASMSNVEDLLQAGVKVYKYKKGFIHAKILLVDGIAASVGTANLDMRSFQINFEVNAFIYDKDIVARMEKDFYMDMEDSEEVILEEYLKRPMWEKIKEATGRLLSPLL